MEFSSDDTGYINRTAIVIKPKKPFFDLMKKVFKEDFNDDEDIEDMSKDLAVYLVPSLDTIEDMEVWLSKNYDIIFREQLGTSINCGELLVDTRTFKLFKEWFDYSLHSEVWDTVDDAVSYTHLRAHETVLDLVCRLLLEKKKTNTKIQQINEH